MRIKKSNHIHELHIISIERFLIVFKRKDGRDCIGEVMPFHHMVIFNNIFNNYHKFSKKQYPYTKLIMFIKYSEKLRVLTHRYIMIILKWLKSTDNAFHLFESVVELLR
jgi:hypothetical protein